MEYYKLFEKNIDNIINSQYMLGKNYKVRTNFFSVILF